MSKKKLTATQKTAKKERQKKFEWIFVNGKQKRIKRRDIEGVDVDEFIENNADPIWLHQNQMWELMPEFEAYDQPPRNEKDEDDNDLPF